MLVEEALPRAVVSRRDCVDGWKHTIQAPVDEGAGHTAELAASIGHVEEAVDLLASGSAVAHVEFIDHEVVDLGDRGEQTFPVRPQEREEIGRASCRERVCPYVERAVVAGSVKKKT